MFDTLQHLFNQRTSGEQTLILIAGAIFFLVLGIQIGRALYRLIGG